MRSGLDRQIIKWHKEAFPTANRYGQWCKLAEEVREWVFSGLSLSELADIYIVCAALYGRWGVSSARIICKGLHSFACVRRAVNRKLKVNRRRCWVKKGRTYRHVETKG